MHAECNTSGIQVKGSFKKSRGVFDVYTESGKFLKAFLDANRAARFALNSTGKYSMLVVINTATGYRVTIS